MLFMLLTRISNFIQIRYYLLFNQKTYFLYTILDYKNLKFKYLNGDIAIDLLGILRVRRIL